MQELCPHDAGPLFFACCASDLAARYADYIDEKRFDEIVDLFAPDAVFDASAFDGTVRRGHEEIRQFYVDAPTSLGHLVTGVYVANREADVATLRMRMLVVFRRSLSVVGYEWGLKRLGSRWQIDRQAIAIASNKQS
jgi:hypothetical protein